MKKYFALIAFVLMLQLSCQQREVVCASEKEEVTKSLYDSTAKRYDSLCKVAMGKNWVIGFLFKSKEKYRMKILMADMFEDTWVRANKPKEAMVLILRKSIKRSFDSIAFSRYNISMDGRIRCFVAVD
ncbi:hypothetical protein [Chitinophaga eiseniae]|uniref:hypothetical protein n=1 Tax=Chitinophaga eiseniae TaxID=634771 RepID=UPI00117857A2|nr:hypothetical protein [Chitinophaga eiseniae]